MVVTEHPDDSEFGAGGTVAKMVKEGREVTYVIVTNGNKGSSDRSMTPERLARIREEEQRNAARTLGVERVEFLGYADGEVEDTRDLPREQVHGLRRRGGAGACPRPTIGPGQGLRLRGGVRPHRHSVVVRAAAAGEASL